MEISAVCANRLVCSSHPPLCPSFSDQSHLEFYQRRTTSLPSLSLRQPPLRSLSAVGPLRAVCQDICPPPLPDAASEASALMKELAELKQLMKQKKKELKLQDNKEEKKRLKMQLKMEKKAMKQKDGMERKKKCDLESSSSSESSDEDVCNKSMSMKMLREQQRPLPCASLADSGTSEIAGNTMLIRDEIGAHGFAEMLTATKRPAHAFFESQSPATVSEGCCDEKAKAPSTEASVRRETLALRKSAKFPISEAPNRVEVCAGGKCRKAGSEQLLAALNMQIPGSSDVVAVPCKCMGKCSMTMNVKVVKEDTNPQHHSHVRVEDANFILNHNYGLGRPPSGLPALEPHDWKRVSVCGTV